MIEQSKRLPPDAALQAVQRATNEKLGPGTAVNLYRIVADDGAESVGMVAEFGGRRANMTPRPMLSLHDVPEIVRAVEDWRDRQRAGERWTPDTAFAPSSMR
jgi:hypothetical protein